MTPPCPLIRPARLAAALALTLLLGLAAGASATTARHLGGRIHVDGFTDDFAADEHVFGTNVALGKPEESTTDSKWSSDKDFHQIRITWDADSLYLAGEGVINGNNMVLLIDAVPGRGLAGMGGLNAWARNFTFSTDFAPDLFCATWDGNTAPRLLIHRGGTQVDDQAAGVSGAFDGSASFSGGLRGRAMEFAIPWRVVFLATEGLGTVRRWAPAVGETLETFPAGTTLKIAGVITGGADGTSGPDVAPDNTTCAASDSYQNVVVDNYAVIELDRNDDSGLGGGGPDGVADWNVGPSARVTFSIAPPIPCLRFSLADVKFDRPAFAPQRANPEAVHFRAVVDPPLDASDPTNQRRAVTLSASVYDLRGGLVRTLYSNVSRPALAPSDPSQDVWDGRDQQGRYVPPGVYVVRLAIEPSISRATRAVVVVR